MSPRPQQAQWAYATPEPTLAGDPQLLENPFKDKRLRDRFGRRLDQVYPAPQDASPDQFSHLLRKIAAQLDR